MSKSYGNAVYLGDDDETVRKKFMNAVTDPQRARRKDPGRPEVCNIFAYHKLYTAAPRLAEIDGLCRTAGIGCVDCKRELIERFFERFSALRSRRRELEKDPQALRKALDAGAIRARESAEANMSRIREAMQMGWRP
jgi:tryptophanyl-tRNA synthetase